MDAEQSIAEIERLERIFAVPDTRPLRPSTLAGGTLVILHSVFKNRVKKL
jgi:hypothetical protein